MSICPQCQCQFGSSGCTHIDGRGTSDDPYIATPGLSTAASQLLECGPAGLGAFTPPYLSDVPCVNVYSNIEQPIPYRAVQGLFFNEERYDTDSMHDVVDKQSRITFNTAGVYLVTLNVTWEKTEELVSSGDVVAYIFKNGSEYKVFDTFQIGGPDLYMGHSIALEDKFQAGEFVEGLVKHSRQQDDEPKTMRIYVSRMSPIFAACFLRPLP